MADNVIPKVNNSRKISELRGRDAITKHQDHSWLAVAQYNDTIGAYHNIAINVASITGYAISASNEISTNLIDDKIAYFSESYYIPQVSTLSYMFGEYDHEKFSYSIHNSEIAYNIVTYSAVYANDIVAWEYYPSKEFNNVHILYLCGEDGEYLLTDKGKKLRVD